MLTLGSITLLRTHIVLGEGDTNEHSGLHGCPQEAHNLVEETDVKQNHTHIHTCTHTPISCKLQEDSMIKMYREL